MIDFDELKALCERATPGPWMHTPGYYNDSGGQYDQIDSPVEIISGEWGGPSGDNAAFIAAANPATILALLSANREMREALEELLASTCGPEVGCGDGGTFVICPPSPDALRKARSALTTQKGGWRMSLVRSGASASIPTCDASKTVDDLPPKRGPVRILCDEIGFQFDPRLERPEVLIAFVTELLSEVQHHHDMAVSIADYTGKVPTESSSLALGLAWVMVRASLREIVAAASAVHDLAHELNPDEAYPTNHTIDMVSSCASAIRFGLEERAWSSRHAAEASNHVWKQVYGVSRFDRNTTAWQREWARSKLLSAIFSLLPSEARTAVEGPSVGIAAGDEPKTLPTNGDSQ